MKKVRDCDKMRKYKGGKVRIFEKFDPDTANIIDLRDMVKKMGYNKFKLWYLEPHSILQWGVKPLQTDGDVLKLAKLVNDVRKYVRNYAGRKNRSNGVGTSSWNARDGNAEGSNEESVGVAPASGHKNDNSTEEVHWDSDELVSLGSSDEDRETLTIQIYSSVGDQLELYV
ncbi:hypothetical protein FEM48_Zijuj01G0211300 [Ziziphus jujuba var. spinosa]|uniref:PB1-like domain-containing protein n=1 Tax=Ziziphus jujuba var. spinosa TaxID=714518 RepID=A0A978W3K2_ZIZJJ|nr:hypothetical protein FEM48_Zijuj01G0211300 [Ziziphus jujuba var. spinosa]